MLCTGLSTHGRYIFFLQKIDFWTTRCIKCPQALDRMNQEAQEMMNKNISSNTNNNIHFVSICLGTDLDTCRNVLEQGNDEDSNIPKWNHLTHYYARNKEAYKEAFSFQQVPYYVVVAHNNDNQEPPQILYKGTKINFQDYYYQLENEENRDNNCAVTIPPSRELSMDDFDLDF